MIVVGAGVLFVVRRDAVRASIESFARAQIESILDDLLVPTVTIGEFSYEWPLTAHVRDVALESEGARIVELKELVVRFARIPRRGEPVHVASLHLEAPIVRLIRDDNGIRGFDDFVQSSGERRPDGTSSVPSDFLRLKDVTIADGEFIWSSGDRPLLTLGGISLEVRTDGATSDSLVASATGDDASDLVVRLPQRAGPLPPGPAVHPFDATLRVNGIGDLTLDADLDLDRGLLRIRLAMLEAPLGPTAIAALPDDLATRLTAWGLQGHLRALASGTLGFDGGITDRLDFVSELTDGHARIGEYEFDVADATLIGTVESGSTQATLDGNEFVGGELDAVLRLDRVMRSASERWEFSGTVDVRDVLLDRLTRPNLRGVLDGDLAFTVPIGTPSRAAIATGGATVEAGRLARIPVIAAVVDAVSGIMRDGPPNDRFDASFTMHPETLRLESFHLLSSTMAATGSGTVGWDGALDLTLNAGPLEALAERTGPLVNIIRNLLSRLSHYRMTGTISDPDVELVPFRR